MSGITLRKRSLPAKVIVVEDDPVLGLSIEQTLIDNGFANVTICPTASCTLGKLRSGSYDAVVLDVHLADSDEGWGIAELVNALGDDNVRIVFQTGSPDDIPAHIRQLGPVLTKPYDPQELVAALRQRPRAGLLALLRR
ncbi:response regulator transcription factor [Qipengyuania sp. ASV99]|uniref:response regulator transcription factor n=1 Tax=Qipengyuania sp. ASV99 TaxID=3399681 RepID=UPI003A4C62CD